MKEKAVTEQEPIAASLWPILVILIAVFIFQLWFLGFWPGSHAWDDATLSKPYTEALAKGQSYLVHQPDPRVLNAKDPFASGTRGLLLWDTSYFKGHFYMYFGIVPFVIFMVPYCLILGESPGPSLTILVFLTAGFAAYGGILFLIHKRWLHRSSPYILALAYLGLVLSSGALSLMSRPAIFEIENAAAFCLFGIGLLLLITAEIRRIHRGSYSTLAALFLALTIGCRPNYFPAVTICFFWLIFGDFFRQRDSGFSLRAGSLIGPLLAIITVAFGLGWWNYHRFGSPVDFGLKHTVSEDPAQLHSLATVRNLPYGLSRYSIGLPRIGRYFPFIEGQLPNPVSVAHGQEESNQVYGFLILSPVLLFPLAVFGCRKVSRSLCAVMALCCACFFGNFLFLGMVTMSCYRYPADFLAPLSLASALGILLVSQNLRFPRFFGVFVTLVVAWNALSAACVLFSIAENANLFAERRPTSFRALSSLMNRPVYLYESLAGDGPTAKSLTLRFPPDRLGKSEPLMVVGEAGAQDFIYIYYAGPNLVRIGFMSAGLQDLQSRLIDANYKDTHIVEIYLGSLLPPYDDPNVRSVPKADLDLARQAIYVKLDNRVVLDGVASFHRPRAKIQIGQSCDDVAFGARFTGEISSVESPPIGRLLDSTRWKKTAYEFPTFEFTLLPMPIGVYDPIVSLGSPGAGAELLVENLPLNEARLVWLASDGSRLQSVTFPIVPNQLLRVRIEAGALLPPLTSTLWQVHIAPEDKALLKRQLSVFLQGKRVIVGQCSSLDIPPDMIQPGIDALTSLAGVLPKFPGQLRRVAISAN